MNQGFFAYHPYPSFTGDTRQFLRTDGKPAFRDADDMADAIDLWQLGKKAFTALGDIESREEFNNVYAYHVESIRLTRLALFERLMERPGSIEFVDQFDETALPDIDDLPSSTIVSIAWQCAISGGDASPYLGGMFLFSCLEQIDTCLIALQLGGAGAVASAVSASEMFANHLATETGNVNLQKVRSDLASRAAIERYKNDPKQVAKAFIYECWTHWQLQRDRYRSQAAFAQDALTKIDVDEDGDPIISFDTIVKKWIPIWNKRKNK